MKIKYNVLLDNMQYFLSIAYITLFTYCIFHLKFFDVPGLSKRLLGGIFMLKILAGLFLWATYSYHYTNRATSDIFKYYDDSQAMYNALFIHPLDYFKMLFGIRNNTPHFNIYYDQMYNWYRKLDSNLYNESHFIIRFNAFIRLISLDVYFVHMIVICFMSMAGLTGIYKFFIADLKDKKILLALSIYFVPSVLLWTSGLIKEAFIVSFLGLLLSSLKNLVENHKKICSLLVIFICTLILLTIKVYILIAIAPPLLSYWWSRKSETKGIFQKYTMVTFSFIGFGLLIRFVFPDYDPVEIIRIKQSDFIAISAAANSRINLPEIDAGVWSLIKNSPNALFNSIFRPLLPVGSVMIYIAAVENWFILLFIICCFGFSKSLSTVKWNPVLMSLLFTLIMYLLIGWTTPVVGAIVRYRVPALPFLLIAFIYLLDMEKVKRLLLWKNQSQE
jgi:hypothetical protein